MRRKPTHHLAKVRVAGSHPVFRSKQVLVSVGPTPRRYEFAGQLLARAITDAERDDVSVSSALKAALQEEGETSGAGRAGISPGILDHRRCGTRQAEPWRKPASSRHVTRVESRWPTVRSIRSPATPPSLLAA